MKPMYLKNMSSEDARKICLDYTLAALHALAAEPRKTPMRFIYVSGSPAVRKVEDKPPVLGDYCVMRVRFLFSLLSNVQISMLIITTRARWKTRSLPTRPPIQTGLRPLLSSPVSSILLAPLPR